MRGSLWAIVVAAIGLAVFLGGGGTAVPSTPSGPASSTQAVADVLGVVAPFVAQLLGVAAIGAIIVYAIRA